MASRTRTKISSTPICWHLLRPDDAGCKNGNQSAPLEAQIKGDEEMKGNGKLIQALNGLLADELTSINQYVVHTEMAENWGYGKLQKSVGARSRTEMKHAAKLIERILFLEGVPIVGALNTINIGADVPRQCANDLASEMTAVASYNRAIKLATDLGDNATREILEGILTEEDVHVNEIEGKLDQIKQMGVQQFLSAQVGE
jgi:bacterioferritin